MPENVILVDTHDRPIGTEEKITAHEKGLLHRAFSVFVFNTKGEMLLQQRHPAKYHSGGLWSNTCCSHPRPGEDTLDAARRRLQEEMGIQCDLIPVFSFTYRIQFDTNLYEYEHDHVFIGQFDGNPNPDPTEIMDVRWVPSEKIQNEMRRNPEQFTYWFRLIFDRVQSVAPV